MIGGFEPEGWAKVAIGIAVAVGVVRLLLWRRSTPPDARGPTWRLALLLALQLVSGALLHLVLFPPSVARPTGTLVVLAGGHPETVARGPGDVLVALPEARVFEGAVRVPDLATALRRFPGAAKLRVEGRSLPPRDQGPLPVPLEFDPPPQARGLIELGLPGPNAPGAAFSVGGQVGTLRAGLIELVDPAGVPVDRERVTAGARFVVGSTTRAPGLAEFVLRLRDPAGALVEQIAVPVETRAQAQPRVLVLAGAPEPETKFLRRWAETAGMEVSVQIELGGGVQLGDAPVPLTRATLAKADLVVIDDRRWMTLDGGARAALRSAVDGGLGLLLRPTGPLLEATRRDWAALGAPLTGGETGRPVRLAPTAPIPEGDEEADVLPELQGRDIAHEGPRAVSILRDSDGAALASWRARGLGRVGVWTVTDSYALVLTGRSDRYSELWSEVFSVLARPAEGGRPYVAGLARAGDRLSVCRLVRKASVVAPDGRERALAVDPATGQEACAAYWPEGAGWHLVRDAATRETPFYVHPAGAAPSLAAAADRRATLAMAATPAAGRSTPSAPRAPGSPWPWFALLLTSLASSWWLERNRGVSGPAPQA